MWVQETNIKYFNINIDDSLFAYKEIAGHGIIYNLVKIVIG